MHLKRLKVFICHSSQDKPVVRELYNRLLQEGWIDPWLDEKKLLPGQDWDLEIEKALEDSHAVIVCVSNKSATKEGYIQKELRFVLDIALTKPEEEIFVIPLRLEDCRPPRRLRVFHYVDYFPELQQDSAYKMVLESLRLRAENVGIDIPESLAAILAYPEPHAPNEHQTLDTTYETLPNEVNPPHSINPKYVEYVKVFEKNKGLLRASEAIGFGVPEYIIYEMVQNGELIKEARGIYRLAGSAPQRNPHIVHVSLLVPKGIICLNSALHVYGLTTKIPNSVYVSLPQNAGRPHIKYPPLEVFWVTNSIHMIGVDVKVLDGVKVKIYDREKTVADCFKFRKRIGENTAIEALKNYVNQPKLDVQKLIEYAKVNRVEKLMTPYLKSLL